MKKVHMRKSKMIGEKYGVYSCDVVIRGKKHHKYRNISDGRFANMY